MNEADKLIPRYTGARPRAAYSIVLYRNDYSFLACFIYPPRYNLTLLALIAYNP